MGAGHGSSDLSSCEKGEQLQLALALLNEMWEANSLEPDVIRVIRQGLGRARRRPGRVRDVGGEAGARRHQPRHWPREAQAWPRARCGRRSWSPTSSAKALAARGAGLAACEMREAKLEPDVISQGIGRARRRPGRRWHVGVIFLQAALLLS